MTFEQRCFCCRFFIWEYGFDISACERRIACSWFRVDWIKFETRCCVVFFFYLFFLTPLAVRGTWFFSALISSNLTASAPLPLPVHPHSVPSTQLLHPLTSWVSRLILGAAQGENIRGLCPNSPGAKQLCSKRLPTLRKLLCRELMSNPREKREKKNQMYWLVECVRLSETLCQSNIFREGYCMNIRMGKVVGYLPKSLVESLNRFKISMETPHLHDCPLCP